MGGEFKCGSPEEKKSRLRVRSPTQARQISEHTEPSNRIETRWAGGPLLSGIVAPGERRLSNIQICK